MPNSWPRYTVAELQARGVLLVEDGNHGEYRPRTAEFGNGQWAFIRAADMDNGRVLFESAERINDVAFQRIRKGIGKGGDVLFSHKGTVGKLAVAPLDAPKFVCSPQTTFWRTLDETKLSRRFLYYYMQSRAFTEQWMGRKGETDMADYVSLTAQRELFVSLPPPPEQKAIAAVLGALDDKIEQNRRTGRALEGLAWATFKAWFVDFEPVKAKAAGQTSFPGLPPAAFAALPDRLTDSPLGPVPQGWSVRPLSKVAAFLNGLALQKYPPVGDGTDLPVIKIAELRKGSTDGAGLANASVPDVYVVEDGDLLFSWSGTLEVELWFGGRGALNQHLFKVTSDAYPLWLCLHWVRQHLPEFRLIASSKATTMGHIKRGHLDAAHVAVPDDVSLQAANRLIGPLYDLHANLALDTRKLAALRDYLLPRLLSGRVRMRTSQTEVNA